MEAGYCKFCGQTYMVEADEDASKDELNELATAKCDCQGAALYAWKKETLAVYDQDLEVIFKTGDDELKELFYRAGRMIMNGQMETLNVRTEHDKTVSLKMKKSALCITITEKTTMENMSHA